MNCWVAKTWEISRVAEELLASQEGVFYME